MPLMNSFDPEQPAGRRNAQDPGAGISWWSYVRSPSVLVTRPLRIPPRSARPLVAGTGTIVVPTYLPTRRAASSIHAPMFLAPSCAIKSYADVTGLKSDSSRGPRRPAPDLGYRASLVNVVPDHSMIAETTRFFTSVRKYVRMSLGAAAIKTTASCSFGSIQKYVPKAPPQL
jgi:hypothetical protein